MKKKYITSKGSKVVTTVGQPQGIHPPFKSFYVRVNTLPASEVIEKYKDYLSQELMTALKKLKKK